MKGVLKIWVISLLCGLASVSLGKVIDVTDFGVKPDTRINAVQGVRAAIEACRGLESATLVFPKGRYDFWAQHSAEIEYYESNTIKHNTKYTPWQGRTAMLTFEGCKHVEIQGNDVANDVLGRNISLVKMDAQEVTVEDGQNVQFPGP
ncbi:MAG: hypothetical protein K9N55_14885 [Phycisphaerae bacterium]|nr:hypothetical protein [Phycisphaerae bacterium]